MIKRIVFLVVILIIREIYGQTECPTAPSDPQDRRTDKSKLTIGTLNAEWLFYTYYSSAQCPGDGCPWKTQQDAMEHLDTMAKVIAEMDVDILNIVEVYDCTVLNMLNDQIGSKGR
jgi:hypothetical protein